MINDMGGVYSSGMMDESTMECIAKTRDMEGYVLSWYYSIGPFKKKIKKHPIRFLKECGQSSGVRPNMSLALVHSCFEYPLHLFLDFALNRVYSSGQMVPCTMENTSLVSDKGRVHSRRMLNDPTTERTAKTSLTGEYVLAIYCKENAYESNSCGIRSYPIVSHQVPHVCHS
jgi:hypothetical protein